MGRENCMMCEEISGEIYCGYYDLGIMLCEENQDCPEELDEDDLYYEEEYYEYDMWDYC